MIMYVWMTLDDQPYFDWSLCEWFCMIYARANVRTSVHTRQDPAAGCTFCPGSSIHCADGKNCECVRAGRRASGRAAHADASRCDKYVKCLWCIIEHWVRLAIRARELQRYTVWPEGPRPMECCSGFCHPPSICFPLAGDPSRLFELFRLGILFRIHQIDVGS